MYGLIDCNHFYVSCERVFNPRLIGKPVVVLSGDQGCVLARSPEAKKLGIPMGVPIFECRNLVASAGVIALTSNFSLYSDLSSRVMQIIEEEFPDIEVYSIDEAFIRSEDVDLFPRMVALRQRILQWVGIPVSIGLAKTKTLAKVATDQAKKKAGIQVFQMNETEEILKDTSLIEIWGIGRGTNETLRRQGLYTAWDFMQMEDGWIRRHLGVVGVRMAMELRGTPCLEIQDDIPIKKTIICSRSFKEPLKDFKEVAEAASCFVARAAEKLRAQDSVTSCVEVFIRSSPFNNEESLYSNKILIHLPEQTAYTPLLIHYVKGGLRNIFKYDVLYKKVGVMLGDIQPNSNYQPTLFGTSPAVKLKQNAAMQVMDELNQSCSRKTLFLAAEGVNGPSTHRPSTTAGFTSRWDELLVVKAR